MPAVAAVALVLLIAVGFGSGVLGRSSGSVPPSPAAVAALASPLASPDGGAAVEGETPQASADAAGSAAPGDEPVIDGVC